LKDLWAFNSCFPNDCKQWKKQLTFEKFEKFRKLSNLKIKNTLVISSHLNFKNTLVIFNMIFTFVAFSISHIKSHKNNFNPSVHTKNIFLSENIEFHEILRNLSIFLDVLNSLEVQIKVFCYFLLLYSFELHKLSPF